jgi:hypothetical protein
MSLATNALPANELRAAYTALAKLSRTAATAAVIDLQTTAHLATIGQNPHFRALVKSTNNEHANLLIDALAADTAFVSAFDAITTTLIPLLGPQ